VTETISISPGEKVILSDKAKYHGTHGTLYLTNKRLIFTYEKRGIIFKGKYTPVNLPLNRISEVAIIGVGPFKKISVNTLRDAMSIGIPRYEFKVHNPETWKANIDGACREVTSQ